MQIKRGDNIVFSTSVDTEKLEEAIEKCRSDVGKIFKTAKNPFYKSSYAPLPDILDKIEEPLSKHGLSLTQWPIGNTELLTRVYHIESGQWMLGSYSVPLAKADPQGSGGALTYMRRYAIVCILRLNVEDDDDGNSVSKQNLSNFQFNKSMSQFKNAKQTGQTADEIITELEKLYNVSEQQKDKIRNL